MKTKYILIILIIEAIILAYVSFDNYLTSVVEKHGVACVGIWRREVGYCWSCQGLTRAKIGVINQDVSEKACLHPVNKPE